MKQRKIKMFKKTLLALSIAGVASFGANAGVLSASIVESGATLAAVPAVAPGSDDCGALASTYSADVTLGGFTPAAGAADTATLAADGGVVGIYNTAANTLVYSSATACTLTINQDTLVDASSVANSLEGSIANGVTVSAVAIAGVGGYTVEDTIRLTITGGTINEAASAGATLTGNAGSAFTLLGVVGNEILFTTDTGSQTGYEIVDIAGVVVTPSANQTEISVEAETQNTANVVYDVSPIEKLTVLEAQYSSMIKAKFDGVIDVATSRLTLAVNAGDTLNSLDNTYLVEEVINADTTVIAVTLETAQGNLVPATADLVIEGDFSWMAQLDTSDDETAITSAELATGVTYLSHLDATLNSDGDDAISASTGYALNEAMTKLTATITTTGGDLDAYQSFSWNVPGVAGETSLNVQDFTASLVIEDASEDTAVVVAADTAIGEWKLNGSVVTIPYMPFGENTKVIMRHTSTGVQTGDITVRYILEDMDATNGDAWVTIETPVVVDVAKGVLDIRDAVMNAIMDDAGVTKGKVAIEITTNVPAADVTVYAAYNVKNSADDRGFVGTFGENGSTAANGQ
jgi:hypothetical protein